jgi:NADP-dependent 3-hydroxy acid dehydrogenase YdfG
MPVYKGQTFRLASARVRATAAASEGTSCAEAVEYIVTSPRRRAVAEIVIRPTDQV